MPIYAYHCTACGKNVERFFRSATNVEEHPQCPECGMRALARQVTKFARVLRSDERLGSIDFDAESGRFDPRDVGAYAKWARRIGEEYDEELGSNFRELAERAESGDAPVERFDGTYGLRAKVTERLTGGSPSGDAMDGVHGHSHGHSHVHGAS